MTHGGDSVVDSLLSRLDAVMERAKRLIDKSAPGLGLDRKSPRESEHWATAYALLGHAEKILNQAGRSLDTDFSAYDFDLWLLKHQGCRSSGLAMWTLPYKRKIWGDEVGTLPGTGYTVPTCLAVYSLLHTVRATGHFGGEMALKAAEEAVNSMVACSTRTRKGRFFWYSTSESHAVPVCNAIALAAGACQRVGELCDRDDLREVADEAVAYLTACGGYRSQEATWPYFGLQLPPNHTVNKSNDLLHEAYVCQGLLTYEASGGRVDTALGTEGTCRAIEKYIRGGSIFDFPSHEDKGKRSLRHARLLAIGQALFVVNALAPHSIQQQQVSLDLFVYLERSLLLDDQVLDRPDGNEISWEIRSIAHLVLGIAAMIKCVSDMVSP